MQLIISLEFALFSSLRQRETYNAHTPIDFMDWVENVYDQAGVKARFMAQWSGNPITELVLRRE